MKGSLKKAGFAIRGNRGFTLVELMILIVIIGILAAISVSNYMRYRDQAELAALKAEMNVLMNAEDAYYITEGKYFPSNGTINIPSGTERRIPELGFTFKRGHKHRFYIYGYNLTFGSDRYDYCYIIVYADKDYNRNGATDILYYLTYVYNNRMVNDRQFYQLN
jgi:prepilin-type N-terminal cleavage/methylation domain-containing protein